MTRAPGDAPRRRPGRRLAGTALLLVAATAVAGLDSGFVPLPLSTPKPAAARSGLAGGATGVDPAKVAGITAAVKAVGAALAKKDPAALAVLADPSRTTTVTALRTLAGDLAALPATDVSLDWAGSWGDGSSADDVVAHGSLLTFVRGYDTAAGSGYVDIGLHRVGSRWLVSSWEWGERDRPPPWTVPGVQAVAKPHVLVIGQAKYARLDARLAARAEAAIVDTRALWTTPDWNGKAVVTAVDETAYLDTWFGAGLAGPGKAHAGYFNLGTTGVPGVSTVNGMRITFGTDFLLRDDRITRADLRYAFTIMSFQATSQYDLPGWLYNGAGIYTGWRPHGGQDALETLRGRGLSDRTWSALRRGTWKPQLTDSQITFGEGAAAKVDNDWDSAFLTAIYIADTFGEPALRGLVADIGGGAGTAQALRKRLRMTQEQLAAKVRVHARALAARA